MTTFNHDRQTSIPMYERPDLLDDSERIELIHMIDFARTHRGHHEALYQLHTKGPVWDGDVISKSQRSDLLDIGACAKVVVKGQEGFNACTYVGRRLLRVYDWLHGPLPGAEALACPPLTERKDRMSDLFRPCPFCGSRTEVWEVFGQVGAGRLQVTG